MTQEISFDQQRKLLADAGYTHGVRPSFGVYVPAWVLIELDLKGVEALIYSYFYAATQANKNEETACWAKGSFSFLSSLLNVTRPNIISAIKNLMAKGLLAKKQFTFSKDFHATNLYAAIVPEGVLGCGFANGIDPERMGIPVSYQNATEVGTIVDINENEEKEKFSTIASDQVKQEFSTFCPEGASNKTAGQRGSENFAPGGSIETIPGGSIETIPLNIIRNKYINKPTNQAQPVTNTVAVTNNSNPVSSSSVVLPADPDMEPEAQPESIASPDSVGRMDFSKKEKEENALMENSNEFTHKATNVAESATARPNIDGSYQLSEAEEYDFKFLCTITKNRNFLTSAKGVAQTKEAYIALLSKGFASWEIVRAWKERQAETDADPKYMPQLLKWLQVPAETALVVYRNKFKLTSYKTLFGWFYDKNRYQYHAYQIPMLTFDERGLRDNSEDIRQMIIQQEKRKNEKVG